MSQRGTPFRISRMYMSVVLAAAFTGACDSAVDRRPRAAAEGGTATSESKALSKSDIDADAAARAVFGPGRPAVARVGTTTVQFKPGRVIQVGSTEIFIASGDALSSAHPDPGYVGFWYLRRKGTKFTVLARHPGFVALGSFGRAPEWKMRADLGPFPVVEVTGFGMWFGHAFTCTSLVALEPQQPKLLLNKVITGYQFDPGDEPTSEPAADVTGSVAYRTDTDRYVVTYRGTTSGEQVFVRKRGRFIPLNSSPVDKRCSSDAVQA